MNVIKMNSNRKLMFKSNIYHRYIESNYCKFN